MRDPGVGVAVVDKARARRFDLQIPVRYRANGDGDWHRGTTRNISRSGVRSRGRIGLNPIPLLRWHCNSPAKSVWSTLPR